MIQPQHRVDNHLVILSKVAGEGRFKDESSKYE